VFFAKSNNSVVKSVFSGLDNHVVNNFIKFLLNFLEKYYLMFKNPPVKWWELVYWINSLTVFRILLKSSWETIPVS
jgi:hypothetical protein